MGTEDKQVKLITFTFKLTMLQYGGMEKEYVGEKQNYGNNISCSSLHSDGDSYPNSPINDLEDSMCTEGILVKEEEEPKVKQETEGVRVKVEPDIVVKQEPASSSYKVKSDQTKPYQIKPEQTKAYQTRPSNTPVNKSTKSSSRKALESCLLSSS